jgi:hypothetical protein
MPHDRRTWRISLIMIGVVCSTVPIGCMKPSILRPGSGPSPELSPAAEPQPGPRTVAAPAPANPANGPQAGAPAAPASIGQVPRAILPAEPSPVASDPTVLQTGAPTSPPPGTGPAIEPQPATTPAQSGDDLKLETPPSTTPLLDAEIRRVEDLTQQHFESTSQAESPAQPSMDPPVRPLLDLESTKPAGPAPEAGPTTASKPVPVDPIGALAEPARLPILFAPTPEVQSRSGSSMPVPVVADGKGVKPAEPTGPETVDNSRPDPTNADRREARQDESVERVGDPPRTDEASRASSPPTSDRPQPGIAELRLCGKVSGFGSFEPLDPTALKPGQLLLVYWEMNGLEYEARGDAFVTRLSTHLELRPESGGPPMWEPSLPTVVKVCPRRRLDNYANACIRLPGSLEPGSYRLRLIQTDLVAERTSSAEIPLTIAP